MVQFDFHVIGMYVCSNADLSIDAQLFFFIFVLADFHRLLLLVVFAAAAVAAVSVCFFSCLFYYNYLLFHRSIFVPSVYTQQENICTLEVSTIA